MEMEMDDALNTGNELFVQLMNPVEFKFVYSKWLYYIGCYYADKPCPFKDIENIWEDNNEELCKAFRVFIGTLDIDIEFSEMFLPSEKLFNLALTFLSSEDEINWLRNYNNIFVEDIKNATDKFENAQHGKEKRGRGGRKRKVGGNFVNLITSLAQKTCKEFESDLKIREDEKMSDINETFDCMLRTVNHNHGEEKRLMQIEFEKRQQNLKDIEIKLRSEYETEIANLKDENLLMQNDFKARQQNLKETEINVRSDFDLLLESKMSQMNALKQDYETQISDLETECQKLKLRVNDLRQVIITV